MQGSREEDEEARRRRTRRRRAGGSGPAGGVSPRQPWGGRQTLAAVWRPAGQVIYLESHKKVIIWAEEAVRETRAQIVALSPARRC